MDVKNPDQLETALFQLHSMARCVEQSFKKAIDLLSTMDSYTADTIIEEDKVVNSYEIDIDNCTYNILALNSTGISSVQLRRILTIQKINPCLERIGDHIVNIAESVRLLCLHSFDNNLMGIDAMATACYSTLRNALQSYFDNNSELADEVLRSDDTIDEQNRSIIEKIKKEYLFSSSGSLFESGFALVLIGKNLERIADLSMNIAEEAVYLIEGCSVKHLINKDESVQFKMTVH